MLETSNSIFLGDPVLSRKWNNKIFYSKSTYGLRIKNTLIFIEQLVLTVEEILL